MSLRRSQWCFIRTHHNSVSNLSVKSRLWCWFKSGLTFDEAYLCSVDIECHLSEEFGRVCSLCKSAEWTSSSFWNGCERSFPKGFLCKWNRCKLAGLLWIYPSKWNCFNLLTFPSWSVISLKRARFSQRISTYGGPITLYSANVFLTLAFCRRKLHRISVLPVSALPASSAGRPLVSPPLIHLTFGRPALHSFLLVALLKTLTINFSWKSRRDVSVSIFVANQRNFEWIYWFVGF